MASTQHPDGTSARLVSVRPSVASRQSVSSAAAAAATTSTTSPSRALAGRAQLAQPPRGEPSRAAPGRKSQERFVTPVLNQPGVDRPPRAGPAVSSHRRGYTAGATRYQQPRRPVRRRPARPGPTRRSTAAAASDARWTTRWRSRSP